MTSRSFALPKNFMNQICHGNRERPGGMRSNGAVYESAFNAANPRSVTRFPSTAGRRAARSTTRSVEDVVEGIDGLALHLDHVVEVGAGAAAGAAQRRDDLAALDLLAALHEELVVVAVDRSDAVAVVDDHRVAERVPSCRRTRTLPRAGAMTSVPRAPAMSMPAWNCRAPVNGETRLPKREVSQPLVGQMAGVDARWWRLLLELRELRERVVSRASAISPRLLGVRSQGAMRSHGRGFAGLGRECGAEVRPKLHRLPRVPGCSSRGHRDVAGRGPRRCRLPEVAPTAVTSSPPVAAEPGRFAMIRTLRSNSRRRSSLASTSRQRLRRSLRSGASARSPRRATPPARDVIRRVRARSRRVPTRTRHEASDRALHRASRTRSLRISKRRIGAVSSATTISE